jgi:hypothetical protein
MVVFASSTSAARPQVCDPPPVGINVCVVDVRPDDTVREGKKDRIIVEFATGVAIEQGDLVAFTAAGTLMEEHFALRANGHRRFRVRVSVPAGTTEVDFLGSSEIQGPFGRSVATVLLTGA